ncbi:hypothetical protein EUTSA_v10000002mg [Eutrema salsugineum]|uniref:Neprosin activation peptide domain-containing protein n=1 Tax=Eutrema salsugineum TaxID=72664 RepID=V4JWK2_EUTSA|nr:hypothetical protein EUTSA_v10000002mg [Eutrema salsugineum]
MEVRVPVMWVLLMCYIFGRIITSHNKGFIEAKSLSKFEDLKIQRKLKTINKPAVKIIKTINGERYECVDFFKQPAFDHPSMKNHTYHYKIGRMWHPRGMRKSKTNNTGFVWGGWTTSTRMMYHGATMELCVTAPKVKPTQFSASSLHFQIGDDYIQIGLHQTPKRSIGFVPNDYYQLSQVKEEMRQVFPHIHPSI